MPAWLWDESRVCFFVWWSATHYFLCVQSVGSQVIQSGILMISWAIVMKIQASIIIENMGVFITLMETSRRWTQFKMDLAAWEDYHYVKWSITRSWPRNSSKSFKLMFKSGVMVEGRLGPDLEAHGNMEAESIKPSSSPTTYGFSSKLSYKLWPNVGLFQADY